jgi:hypothetical protein
LKRGLNSDNPEIKDLLASMPQGTVEALLGIAADYLQKAGLTELSTKLKSYSV